MPFKWEVQFEFIVWDFPLLHCQFYKYLVGVYCFGSTVISMGNGISCSIVLSRKKNVLNQICDRILVNPVANMYWNLWKTVVERSTEMYWRRQILPISLCANFPSPNPKQIFMKKLPLHPALSKGTIFTRKGLPNFAPTSLVKHKIEQFILPVRQLLSLSCGIIF